MGVVDTFRHGFCYCPYYHIEDFFFQYMLIRSLFRLLGTLVYYWTEGEPFSFPSFCQHILAGSMSNNDTVLIQKEYSGKGEARNPDFLLFTVCSVWNLIKKQNLIFSSKTPKLEILIETCLFFKCHYGHFWIPLSIYWLTQENYPY